MFFLNRIAYVKFVRCRPFLLLWLHFCQNQKTSLTSALEATDIIPKASIWEISLPANSLFLYSCKPVAPNWGPWDPEESTEKFF